MTSQWRHVICSFLLAVASTTAANIIHDNCNATLRSSDIEAPDLTVRLRTPTTTTDDEDASMRYCWTRFEGAGNQFIEITVKELRLGRERSSCENGFLRISDHQGNGTDWLPPPTTLCGSHSPSLGKLRVRRRTRTPFALVESKYDKTRPEGGFEYDATFVNKEEDTDKLPYGHFDRKEGRLPNTACDWLIPVDDCIGYCNVISPGHPGIYPPNTRCRYLFTNPDNLRVELKFGGQHFSGIFDLRNSENCEEDYVEVYDGRSVTHPLIGRFCGRSGAHLISSGSSILMIFQSGPGEDPPWNYTGFSMQTTERWNYQNDPSEGGSRKPNSSCDFVFHSMNSFMGDLHTPDYFLATETNCTYEFHGLEKYRERVEITIVTQQLNSGDLVNCTEMLAVYDGAREIKRFCLDRTSGGRSEFVFNTTSTSAYVRYYLATGQTSNPDPSWIYFKFWKLPKLYFFTTATSTNFDGSRKSAGRYELSSNPPTALRDLIVLDLPPGPLPFPAPNVASPTPPATTTTVHRLVIAVTAFALRYVTRFS